MCWKLADNVSREIIYRSTIYSAIESGTTNLQVNPVEPIPVSTVLDHDYNLLDKLMSLPDFDTAFLHDKEKGLVDSISARTKSKT